MAGLDDITEEVTLGSGLNGLAPIHTAQPLTAPDQRLPLMAELPGGDGISDADLLTPEEAAEQAMFGDADGLDDDQMVDSQMAEAMADHDYNLALILEDTDLNKIGDNLIEKIDADIASQKPWEERFARGLEIVGLKDWQWSPNHQAPFEGASTAVNPVLADAVVQSQARIMEEVFPPQGPAKAMVMGQDDDAKQESADRVQAHMNWQLTVEDPTYYKECEKLSLYLPIYGTGYRKGYHDYVLDQNLLRFVPGQDLIINYKARSLETARRVTHRYPVTDNEFNAGKKAGAYRDIVLPEPPITGTSESKADEEKEKLDGETPSSHPDDKEWTFYECDCYLDLPGFEDKVADRVTGAEKKSGVALPYTVTLEKESHKIVAIRRCWDENDQLKKKSERYAEYWFLPGIGSKGMGLIHFIGALAEASTDALRALLDSATWANLQGGFKAKDASNSGGELHMAPGVWKDIGLTAEELKSAFHTPPFREPSEALFKLLGFLTDSARRFCSTTDMMVGDSQAKGAPVGTTVALIEQGSKVYSGVHRRCHAACGAELRMLYSLNSRFVPVEGYKYEVPGDELAAFRKDYNTKTVCVVPVSDPNIFSQTQRIALAQSEYQLAKENPDRFDMDELLKRMLKAFKEPDPDGILIDPKNVPVMDPITENIAMTTGRPVRAKDGENHDAHLIAHMAFMQHPQFGGLPQAQQLLAPAMMAHIAEHVALKYADVQRQLGVPVPPINLSTQPGKPITGGQMPEQTDQIAVAAAQMTGAFLQQSGLTVTPPGQENQDAVDRHHESQAKQWSLITGGLASLAKAGQTLVGGLQAEQIILGADGKPVAPQPGAGPVPPVGPAPQQQAAPAPPAQQPKIPVPAGS